jgi:hypothetical protein
MQSPTNELVIIIILAVATAALAFISYRLHSGNRELVKRYTPIVNVEKEVSDAKQETQRLKQDASAAVAAEQLKRKQLEQEYERAKTTHESLKAEISVLEENLEDLSFGLYKPHFNFQSSEEYKAELEGVWIKMKGLVQSGGAATCSQKWTVGGSAAEGARMAKQNIKLFLRAFNGECDAAIAKVTWNNVTKMEARIQKSFEAINQLGQVLHVSISPEYLKLRLDELRLTHEYEEKKYQEKEKQRQDRERIREEEKAQKELERARQQAEEEESRYQKALEQARAEAAQATGAQLDRISDQIQSIETKLYDAHNKKERAVARAQLAKSGFIYVISNIGSFGERVYKIGMTRRMEPLERIAELGDASVPFPFDVHALMFSENAPELEYAIHELFREKRVNLVNPRKEFYSGVELAEIERFIRERGVTAQFMTVPEAKEYRETVAMRQQQAVQTQTPVASQAAFPKTIFAQT